MNLTDIKLTKKLLDMSEAAAPFFKDHEFKEGDFFGARNHTCDNETFWHSALPGLPDEKKWKPVMLAGAGKLVCGHVNDNVDSPIEMLACGHLKYETVFHVFRPFELLEMLHDSNEGYFNEKWNVNEPLKMMLKIVTHSSESFKLYFYRFESFEEFMLAFYMLEVYSKLWDVTKGKWTGKNES